MQATCRSYDDVGRFGGEEFCILRAETPLADALDFAERLRATIVESVFDHGDLRLSVTVRIGVVQYGAHFSDVNMLIESADQALFEAKRSGRNRVRAMFIRDPSRELLCDLALTQDRSIQEATLRFTTTFPCLPSNSTRGRSTGWSQTERVRPS